MNIVKIAFFFWISLSTGVREIVSNDCSHRSLINIEKPTQYESVCCQIINNNGVITSFNVSSNLVLRFWYVKSKYISPNNTTMMYVVAGKWNNRKYTYDYLDKIFDVWSESGITDLSVVNKDVKDEPINIFYAAYDCNNAIENFDDCGQSIQSIITEAPPGLLCRWQLESPPSDKVFTVGLFGFHSSQYHDSTELPSITVVDSVNGCLIGRYYFWPRDKSDITFVIRTNTQKVELLFNTGYDTNICKDSPICVVTRNLKISYKLDAVCDKCTWSNESERFCGVETEKAQLRNLSLNRIKFDTSEKFFTNAEQIGTNMVGKARNFNLESKICDCSYALNCTYSSTVATTSARHSTLLSSSASVTAATTNLTSSVSFSSPSSSPSSSRKESKSTTTTTRESSTTMHNTTSTKISERTTIQSSVTSTSKITTSRGGETSTTLNQSQSSTIQSSVPPISTVTTTSTATETTLSSSTTTETPFHILWNISQWNITEENVYEALSLLHDILEYLPSTSLTSTMVADMSTILSNSADVGPLNNEDCIAWMNDINLLLNANDSSFREAEQTNGSCSDLLFAIDQVARNAVVNESLNSTFFYNGTSVSLSVTDNNCTIDIYKNGICQTVDGNVFTFNSETEPFYEDIQAYLYLPKDLVCNQTTRVVFKVYNTVKLFLNLTTFIENKNFLQWFYNDVIDGSGTTWCDQMDLPESHVVSSTILGQNTSSLPKSASIALKLPNREFTHQEISCAFWNNFTSSWDSEGCRLLQTKNGIATFEASHLTDFALLVTVQPTDPSFCNQTLDNVGFVVSIISTVALGLVLLMIIYYTYVSRKKRRDVKKYLYSIFFNGTLFAFFLVFTVASDQTRVSMTLKSCQINAAILYTLLLSVMLWILARSIQFYKLYVVVFQTDNRIGHVLTSIPVTLLACFGIPTIITILLWYGAPKFFQRNDQFCWIMPELTLYGVVVPMSVLIVVNIVVTILVSKSLFSVTLSRDKNSQTFKAQNSRTIFWRKIWIILAMQIILCIPWIMQYFTFINIDLNVFHYIFTILNGLQGLWIAVIYVYENRNKFKKVKQLQKTTTEQTFLSIPKLSTTEKENMKIERDKVD